MKTTKRKTSTRDIALLGVLIAVVAVATRLGLNITGTEGGYAHFGNVPLFIIAILLGKRKGAIAGGLGMALFDLLSEYFVWAPFTLIVRAVMGYIIGSFAWSNGRKGKSFIWNLIGILIASIAMLVGYYFTEVILYGSWIAAFNSIPGNLAQLVVGIAVGLPLSMVLINNKSIQKFTEEVK